MGNYANKLLFRVHENSKENNETDSNVQTPKFPQRKLLCDPRSISVGITRTPIEIQVKNTPPLTETKRIPSAIPRHLQTKQFLETNLDVIMPPLSPKKPPIPRSIANNFSVETDERHHNDYLTPRANATKNKKKLTPIDKERYRILGLDPRSPAADFERTPILVSRSLALIKARSQENLSRKGSYETDVYNPDSPGNLEVSLSRSIPELLSNVASEIRAKLNLEQPNESVKSESSSDEVFESEEKEVTVINNSKFKKRQEASSISCEQTIDEQENMKSDNYENTESNTKSTHSSSDDKIKVWHDSSSSEKELSGKKEIKNIIEKAPRRKTSREEIIITFDECTTISTSVNTIKAEGCHEAGEVEDGKRKYIKPDVKFTSSEKKIFTPEKKCGTETPMNRTPLGNRSNNGKKMALNLAQRSRNKVDTRVQQENTPPTKKYNTRIKSGNQWDPNTTVFI